MASKRRSSKRRSRGLGQPRGKCKRFKMVRTSDGRRVRRCASFGGTKKKRSGRKKRRGTSGLGRAITKKSQSTVRQKSRASRSRGSGKITKIKRGGRTLKCQTLFKPAGTQVVCRTADGKFVARGEKRDLRGLGESGLRRQVADRLAGKIGLSGFSKSGKKTGSKKRSGGLGNAGRQCVRFKRVQLAGGGTTRRCAKFR